jgi:hypothetical protein
MHSIWHDHFASHEVITDAAQKKEQRLHREDPIRGDVRHLAQSMQSMQRAECWHWAASPTVFSAEYPRDVAVRILVVTTARDRWARAFATKLAAFETLALSSEAAASRVWRNKCLHTREN